MRQKTKTYTWLSYIILLSIVLSACREHAIPKPVHQDIQSVEIIYGPSFHHSAVVYLDLKKQTGMVRIVERQGIPLPVPDSTLSFSLKDLLEKTSSEKFFDRNFLDSMYKKKFPMPNVDGIGLQVVCQTATGKDTVDMGNTAYYQFENICYEQMKYFTSITTDSVMRSSLRLIARYLGPIPDDGE